MSIDLERERMPRPKKIDTAILALALTTLLNIAAMVWWGSDMNTRVQSLERETAPLRAMTATVERLDERTKGIERIERKLDAMEARQ